MLRKILHHLDGESTPPEAPQVLESQEQHPEPEGPELTISVPSWLGHRVVCPAQVLKQDDDALVLSVPQDFEKGQYVWIDKADERLQCVVDECRSEGDAWSLTLYYRPDRRTGRREKVAIEGELEWLHGHSRVQLPISLTNLSESGAQLRLSQAGPQQGDVVVRYQSRSREAAVRYSVHTGDAHLVGVEFRR